LINTIAIITVALALLTLCGLVGIVLRKINMTYSDMWQLHDDDELDEFKLKTLGDLQQIKTRLAWSKKREKKDLKQERTR
jgi:hypothetical protein